MAVFSGLLLTNKGKALQAKIQTGKQIVFTRAASGDGALGGTDAETLTALISQKQSLPIVAVRVDANGNSYIRTELSNEGLSLSYYFREIGIFALDPDLGEVLYCYANNSASTDLVPAPSTAVIKKTIDVVTVFTNTSSVSVTLVDSTGDAVASDVRAGKTFTNTDGEAVGTLVDRGNGGTVTPGTTNQTFQAGIYGTDIVVLGDTDLVAGNIKAGKNIFGVVGKTEVVDTTEATSPAVAANIVSGKVGFVNGAKVTGTMPNNGGKNTLASFVSGTDVANQIFLGVPKGYYDGAYSVYASDANFSASNIKSGVSLFGLAGSAIEATGNASAADVLAGKTFSKAGQAGITGTMPNRGAPTITPGTTPQSLSAGYYSGGTIAGDSDLIAGNIKSGVNIFGVVGTFNGKRWAMGSVQSNDANISVRGLLFKPSVVLIQAYNSAQTEYFSAFHNRTDSNGTIDINFSIRSSGSTPTIASAVVYSDGFDIKNPKGGVLLGWIAIE